jgi:hypothetical protein
VQEVLPDEPQGVVLDVGGDSVFRVDADSQLRLAQVERLKRDSRLAVILLQAPRELVRERYLNCGKPATAADFDRDWQSWLIHMEPHWVSCADRTIRVDRDLDQDVLVEIAFPVRTARA